MIQALLEVLGQKKYLVIAIGVALLLNIILYAVIRGYQSPAISQAQAKANELKHRVALAGPGDVNTVYRQGKIDLEALQKMIPTKREFPGVLGDILDAAASSGVKMGNMTYKPQAIKDQNLLAYSVNTSVGGTYAAVKSFLADLQKNRKLVVIDTVLLTNSDPYEENVTLDLRLTVYLREAA